MSPEDSSSVATHSQQAKVSKEGGVITIQPADSFSTVQHVTSPKEESALKEQLDLLNLENSLNALDAQVELRTIKRGNSVVVSGTYDPETDNYSTTAQEDETHS